MTGKQLHQVLSYSDDILELIDNQLRNDTNTLTQSDLQGAVGAIVHKIISDTQTGVKNPFRVNYKLYKKQINEVANAMAEMDENSPEAFELFLMRMLEIGAIEARG